MLHGELRLRDCKRCGLQEERAEVFHALLERVALAPDLDRLGLLQIRQRLPPALRAFCAPASACAQLGSGWGAARL